MRFNDFPEIFHKSSSLFLKTCYLFSRILTYSIHPYITYTHFWGFFFLDFGFFQIYLCVMSWTMSFLKSWASISLLSSIYSNHTTLYPVGRGKVKNQLLFKPIFLTKKVKINIRCNEIKNSGKRFLSVFCPF